MRATNHLMLQFHQTNIQRAFQIMYVCIILGINNYYFGNIMLIHTRLCNSIKVERKDTR